MATIKTLLRTLSSEDGHAITLPGVFLGGAGAVLLAIGAANNNDILTIIGGIVLAIGLLASSLLAHIGVEYGIFHRLDDLEKD